MTDAAAIIRCDRDGMVADVLHAGGALAGVIRRGRPLTAMVARDNFAKALDFIAAVRRDGGAYDWEMALTGDLADMVCRFSGGMDGDEMTVAITPVDGHPTTAEPHAGLDSQALASFRQAFKQRDVAGGGFRQYESLSLINNDLITTQRELAKTIAKLQAANEQKNRVVGILAHDLRNPLNAIIGFAGLLELVLSGRVTDEEMSFLGAIGDSGRDMLTLVEGTLSMSTFEAGQMRLDLQAVDLGALAARAVKLLAVMAESKGVRLMLDKPERPSRIRADATKISQVLNNLIVNAIKFSHSDSEISVAVSGGTDGWAHLTVSDQGTGIPPEVKASLFEPFTKGHRAGTAGESTTGLGLYICRSIVVAHGGAISVSSERGRGTVFTVSLPCDIGVP